MVVAVAAAVVEVVEVEEEVVVLEEHEMDVVPPISPSPLLLRDSIGSGIVTHPGT